MDEESTTKKINQEIPIKINLQIDNQLCRIDGNVTVTLNNISSTTDELENRNPNPNELRRRKIEIDREKSSPNESDQLSKSTSKTEFPFSSMDMAKSAAQNIAQKMWDVMHFGHLPDWMRDNEYILFGHRPPTPSYIECYKSIFRVHTETGNIWSHMVGMIIFIGIAIYFLTRPVLQLQDKLAVSPFFVGAIGCLFFSFTFHTVHCHSEQVGRFFNKLDYIGILLLQTGSFVPWLHYSFYCRPEPKIIYMLVVLSLGCFCLILTLSDKFGSPNFRTMRTCMFSALGGFGIVPFVHFCITDGYHTSLKWLLIMGAVYLAGGVLYAARIPERFFPGKCDIWWQSHQIFHLCVVAAAMTHYHGITEMAHLRLAGGWPCQTW